MRKKRVMRGGEDMMDGNTLYLLYDSLYKANFNPNFESDTINTENFIPVRILINKDELRKTINVRGTNIDDIADNISKFMKIYVGPDPETTDEIKGVTPTKITEDTTLQQLKNAITYYCNKNNLTMCK